MEAKMASPLGDTPQGENYMNLMTLWPVLLASLLHSSAWSTVAYKAADDTLSGRIGGLAVVAPALAVASAQVPASKYIHEPLAVLVAGAVSDFAGIFYLKIALKGLHILAQCVNTGSCHNTSLIWWMTVYERVERFQTDQKVRSEYKQYSD